MIIRQCYKRISSIIEKKVLEREAGTGRRAGIIFTAAQGTGKTWLSLFIVWSLIHKGKIIVIVYE